MQGGVIEYCAENGIEIVPTIFAYATPSGPLQAAVYQVTELLQMLLQIVISFSARITIGGYCDALIAGM